MNVRALIRESRKEAEEWELQRRAQGHQEDFKTWRDYARDKQIEPKGKWRIWLICAGRGWGKTLTGANWHIERRRNFPKTIGFIMGPTWDHVEDVMIGGPTGILACAPPDFQPRRSGTNLYWPNGSITIGLSAETGGPRGPQAHDAWGDEPREWKDAPKGDVVDTAWNNLSIAVRLGDDQRIVLTTTPKANAKLIWELVGRRTTILTEGSMYENIALSPDYIAEKEELYVGTRVEQQELHGKLIKDSPSSYWGRDLLARHRIPIERLQEILPKLVRVVVSLDPTASVSETSDAAGLAVVGIDDTRECYVLEAMAGKWWPHEWARKSIALLRKWRAECIVYEANQGGLMVENTIHQIRRVTCVSVHAHHGKRLRAAPVSAAYQQGRVHHIGELTALEDEMCGWDPEDTSADSPNMVDAVVQAILHLRPELKGQIKVFSRVPKDESGRDNPDLPVPDDDMNEFFKKARVKPNYL